MHCDEHSKHSKPQINYNCLYLFVKIQTNFYSKKKKKQLMNIKIKGKKKLWENDEMFGMKIFVK